MDLFISYLMVGAAAGLAAGLLGIGGGLIIVPFLVWTMTSAGVADTVIMQMAVGTSLATIVFTAISSATAHARRSAVRWQILRQLLPGIITGAAIGAIIADNLSSLLLQQVFGFFELGVAAIMLFGVNTNPHRDLPGIPGMITAGTIIGCCSAIVGIGGGTLTVPFLTWCNIKIHHAIGTAAATGLPIAVAGAAAFMITGLNAPTLPAWSTGYIYWPAFGGIVIASVLAAPLGARLAHALPTHILKRVFALFLAFLGLRMLGVI